MRKIVTIFKFHQRYWYNKIFRFDGANTATSNMFSVKYQLFLNDMYYFGSTEILTHAMTKRFKI